MRHIYFIFALILGCASAEASAAGGEPIQLTLGEKYTIQSTVLSEQRELLVKLPASYGEGDKSYPLIISLDANNHFAHASVGTGLLQEWEVMPEAILIAIRNAPRQRGRDLVGAKDNFRKFIADEVFAFADENFRTNGHRTLFGHSLAGYFTLSILADHSDMFDNYIAASPVIQVRDSELMGKFETLQSSGLPNGKRLYFTITDAANEVPNAKDAYDKFVKLLNGKAIEGLTWRSEFFGGHVHMTTPYLTLYSGLTFAFGDAE
jgi:predicted alpha/beta superfamily hydrolase